MTDKEHKMWPVEYRCAGTIAEAVGRSICDFDEVLGAVKEVEEQSWFTGSVNHHVKGQIRKVQYVNGKRIVTKE